MDFEQQALRDASLLTQKDIENFYEQLEKIPTFKSPLDGKSTVLCFEFMEDTGSRVTETIHVKKKDVNFKTRVLTITHPKTEAQCKCSKWKYRDEYTRVRVLESSDPNCIHCFGKGKWKKPQLTTITPRIYQKLIDYCRPMKDEDYLFPVSRQSLWKWGKKAGQLAELNIFKQKKEQLVEGVFLHLFRALCSLRMTRDAKDDLYTQQLISCKLRHSFQAMVDRYTVLDIGYLLSWEDKTYGNKK